MQKIVKEIINWIIQNKEWIFNGLGVALLIALGRILLKGLFPKKTSILPDDSTGVVEDIEHAPYEIEPATADDIRWIALKAKELYGSSDSIPVEVKLSWYEKFPQGFWIIRDRKGGNTGSFEFFPVQRNVIARLANGHLRERELTKDDIFASNQLDKVDSIYIENVMSLRKDNDPNQWAFKKCLISIPEILQLPGVVPERITLYAMPLKEFRTKHGRKTSTSERLLQKLGFNMVASKTKQEYPLYSINLKSLLKTLASIKGKEK